MISDDYIHLVEKLVERTKAGEVNWKSTVSDNEFMVYFKNFSLSVSTSYDPDEDRVFAYLSLRNDSGKEIDKFWIDQDDEHFQMISDMHAGARRKAFRIDEALHTIMSELNSDGAVGLKKKPAKNVDNFDDDIPF